jgi:hypothetical protein
MLYKCHQRNIGNMVINIVSNLNSFMVQLDWKKKICREILSGLGFIEPISQIGFKEWSSQDQDSCTEIWFGSWCKCSMWWYMTCFLLMKCKSVAPNISAWHNVLARYNTRGHKEKLTKTQGVHLLLDLTRSNGGWWYFILSDIWKHK